MADVPATWQLDTTSGTGGIQTLSVSTDLNGKLSGTTTLISSAGLGSIIDNSAGLWNAIKFEVTLGSINTAAGAGFGLYLIGSLDGIIWADPVLSGALTGANNIGVATGTGVKEGVTILRLDPFYSRLLFVNNLQVTTAASGNTIRYQFLRERSIV